MHTRFFTQYLKAATQLWRSWIKSKKIGQSFSDLADSSMVDDYDPTLIPRLMKDHQEILEYNAKITKSALKDDWSRIHLDFIQLNKLLHKHFATESHALYARLEDAYAPRSEEYRMIVFIRQEMDMTGSNFIEFIEFYADIAKNSIKQRSFTHEFNEQCYALRNKISLEENSLYPIYDLLYKKG